MPARRRPDTVRELEALQQEERGAAAEPALKPEDFERKLRESIHQGIISSRLESGGLDAVVAEANEHEKLVDEKYKSLLAQWSIDDPTQWSRFEAPGMRWGIANLSDKIESAFARHGWPLPEPPVIGTLTTGQVSAVTQKTATGSPIVLIDNGFFNFAHILSQITVFSAYDLQVRGGLSEAVVQIVSDLAATHTVMNTCLYLYRRPTPPQFRPQVNTFHEAICLFVLAHEHAHISVGDLEAHPLHSEEAKTLRSKEFAADQIGFITSAEETHDPSGYWLGVYGAFLYFAGLDLLGRARAAYEGRAATFETKESSEYPTPYERTVNLLQWLEKAPFAEPYLEHVRAASRCYNIILSAWDLVMPGFWAAREALREFDPAVNGGVRNPDADVLGVVQTAWHYVSEHLAQS